VFRWLSFLLRCAAPSWPSQPLLLKAYRAIRGFFSNSVYSFFREWYEQGPTTGRLDISFASSTDLVVMLPAVAVHSITYQLNAFHFSYKRFKGMTSSNKSHQSGYYCDLVPISRLPTSLSGKRSRFPIRPSLISGCRAVDVPRSTFLCGRRSAKRHAPTALEKALNQGGAELVSR